MVKVKEYKRRNPKAIKAVQCTASNMDELAKWCDGDIEPGPYIFLYQNKIYNAARYYRSRARVGDYVLKHPSGRFCILTSNEFREEWELACPEPGE